jgi:hypothetical protein
MAVELNNSAYEHAQSLIKEGHSVYDERDDWSEAAESRAGQYDHHDIEHLHGMIEEAS